AHVQPSVVQSETQAPVSEPVVAPVSALMPNLKPSILYPSRRDNERCRDQANEQIEKFYEIFKDISFEISFTDALILMPKFVSTLKALIGNNERLSEMARTPMNEHCSAIILNKLPKKLGDPGKFLIPCEFLGMDECLELADLGASINLMPLSVWEGLSLPELTPTCMTLKLADRSVSKPIGIAKDVSVKVGVFHFSADFVVVDFEPDPRVPLILGRCFLKTSRALIDVYKGELTLYIRNESITYHLDQTLRYSANYNQMTVNKIDVIDMACEDYSQEVLCFSDVTTSGNPTLYDDPIMSTTSPTLTPFGDSDFLLFEEAGTFLGLEDNPNLPKFNPFYYDPEGDILLLESILNSEPLPLLPNHEQYMPSFKKELKVCEAKTVKPSVDEPPEVEIKDLPLHLEYAFLEGDNKLPVIIAKELGDGEKSALIKVLKSHKRAIAWKLSDIQAPTEGYEDAIVVPAITADNFKLKHGLLTLVQNKQFFGHDKEDPHAHIRYFNKITSTLKFLNVPNTSIKLKLFPFSLEGAARIWLEKEPPRSIFPWDDLVSKFINQFFPPSKKTNLRNEITNFQQRFDESFSEARDRFKDLLRAYPHHGFSELHQLDTFYNALNSKDQDSLNSATSGNFLDKMPRECLAIIKSKSKVRYSRNKPVVAKVSMNTSTSGISPDVAELKDMCLYFSGTLPSNTIANPRSGLKAITTRSGVSYDGPQIPPPPSFLPEVVENEPETTKDTMHHTNNGSTEDVQPLVVQSESPILTFEPVNSPTIEPVASPVSAPRPKLRPSIPYPSKFPDQKLRDKANDQREKFFQICKDLNLNISFADALIMMPKKVECLALADLDASINLMPLSVWNKLSLPDLSHTYMTLELADHSISRPVGVAEDVYVKVGTIYFSADFIAVYFDVDPRVPLILGGSFLKTGRALIDVFEGELTLRVGKEAITFNLDQTSRYSANYSDMTTKRIDVIDMACEEYSREVLGFSNVIASGNPTLYYDPIVSTTSLTLTPFENSNFFLKEFDAFLALEDDPTSPKVDQSLPPLNQGNYLPEVRKELKIYEAKSNKSSIDEPLEVEVKDLPPHLEYAFLEGNNKFPVIIAKDLSMEEKTALI
nr:reverse transcriptase domain-containing protein [Tanacetum cinerariifolium]